MRKQDKQTRHRPWWSGCQGEGVWAVVMGEEGQIHSDRDDLTCGGHTMQYTEHVL